MYEDESNYNPQILRMAQWIKDNSELIPAFTKEGLLKTAATYPALARLAGTIEEEFDIAVTKQAAQNQEQNPEAEDEEICRSDLTAGGIVNVLCEAAKQSDEESIAETLESYSSINIFLCTYGQQLENINRSLILADWIEANLALMGDFKEGRLANLVSGSLRLSKDWYRFINDFDEKLGGSTDRFWGCLNFKTEKFSKR